MSLLGNYGAASATIIADEPCELITVEMSFIDKLFESEPQLATRFYMFLGQKLSQILISISSQSPSSKQTEVQESEDDKNNEPNNADCIVSTVFGLSQEEVVMKCESLSNFLCSFLFTYSNILLIFKLLDLSLFLWIQTPYSTFWKNFNYTTLHLFCSKTIWNCSKT